MNKKKLSVKTILLIIFALILLAIIIGLIVGLITNSTTTTSTSTPGPPCKDIGDNCSNNLDCCSYYCSNGKCSCKPVGQKCSNDDASNCCSNYCSDGKCTCMPLNHRWCTDGTCCGEAECKQVIEDGSFLVKKCCIPENKSCQIDSDCCTGNCQGNKTCGPPLQCNMSITTNIMKDGTSKCSAPCAQQKPFYKWSDGPINYPVSIPGKCTNAPLQTFLDTIPSNLDNALNQDDQYDSTCGTCSDKPTLTNLHKNCSSGKLYSANPLKCGGTAGMCINKYDTSSSVAPSSYSSCAFCAIWGTPTNCKNFPGCTWTTNSPKTCGGCSPYDCENIRNKQTCINTTYKPSGTKSPATCQWLSLQPISCSPYKLNYSCHQCIPPGESCSNILPDGTSTNPHVQCCSGSSSNNKCD